MADDASTKRGIYDHLDAFASKHNIELRLDDVLMPAIVETIQHACPALEAKKYSSFNFDYLYEFVVSHDEIFPQITSEARNLCVAALRSEGFSKGEKSRKKRSRARGLETTDGETKFGALVAASLKESGALTRLCAALDTLVDLSDAYEVATGDLDDFSAQHGTNFGVYT